ncbi:peptide deformylase [Bajunvirus bajun]|uniref:Peptide deformylase n=1 Tax=Brevundimonas phage vB_BgoS-Bajun TaxID=2948594 RepID=A0A9E7SU76_9CAUD|nr:peptide deformylase [Brevundimonas phage vB_BgoS-Bajun]
MRVDWGRDSPVRRRHGRTCAPPAVVERTRFESGAEDRTGEDPLIRPIVSCTDPFLRIPSVEIATITQDVRDLARDLVETALHHEAAGIAAPQVGAGLRMVCYIDVPGATNLPQVHLKQFWKPTILINPVISKASEAMIEWDEGCLSMPGSYFPVSRHRLIDVSYTDLNGETQTITDAGGYKAICLQHEIDHLDGILNIDRIVGPLKKAMIMTSWRKAQRRAQRAA